MLIKARPSSSIPVIMIKLRNGAVPALGRAAAAAAAVVVVIVARWSKVGVLVPAAHPIPPGFARALLLVACIQQTRMAIDLRLQSVFFPSMLLSISAHGCLVDIVVHGSLLWLLME